MKSTMAYDFRGLPEVKNIPASRFTMDRGYKTTIACDKIYPFFIQETYPGDVFNIDVTQVLKALAPLHLPGMDNLHVDVAFFQDANRNLWENWREFMGDKDPTDLTEYSIPQVVAPAGTGYASYTFFDYVGLPVGVPGLSVSNLPGRMYHRIYNKWFRDENLIDKVIVDTDAGPDAYDDYDDIFIACKRHDYFTSCLPTPQKGEDIYLSLGESAPVIGDGKALGLINEHPAFPDQIALGGMNPAGTIGASESGYGQTLPYEDIVFPDTVAQGFVFGVTQDADRSGMIADLTNGIGPLINDFRYAVAVQEMRERDARYGSRLDESIYAHFGVTIPEYRIMEPEYIGGGHYMISPREIVQTSQSDETDQGTRTGILHNDPNKSKIHANCAVMEHGFIMGVMCIRADLSYQQGIQRFWSRQLREEFYYPVMANLGEMAVLNKEIYAQGTEDDDEVFGYQDPFGDLKYGVSLITGQLRNGVLNSLENWHLSEAFDDLPTLSESFIISDADNELDRWLTVQTNEQFVVDMYIRVNAQRPLPVYANPQIGSRF